MMNQNSAQPTLALALALSLALPYGILDTKTNGISDNVNVECV